MKIYRPFITALSMSRLWNTAVYHSDEKYAYNVDSSVVHYD